MGRLALAGVAGVVVGTYAEWAFARTGASAVDVARDLAVGWTFVGSGLVAGWRWPGRRVGHLMVAEGLTWFVGNLQGAGAPFLVAAGAWLEALNDAILAHLLLSFPTGRLGGRAARSVVVAAYGVVLVVGLLRALTFDPSADGWATYLSCSRCGGNGLLVDPNSTLFGAIDLVYRSLGAVISIACVAVIARRWQVSSRATRKALWPLWTAAVVAGLLVSLQLLDTILSGPVHLYGEPLLWALDLGQLAIPVTFLSSRGAPASEVTAFPQSPFTRCEWQGRPAGPRPGEPGSRLRR